MFIVTKDSLLKLALFSSVKDFYFIWAHVKLAFITLFYYMYDLLPAHLLRNCLILIGGCFMCDNADIWG